MKIVISIFCLPYEIDDLENTLNQLKRASYYCDKSIDWNLDVTLCTSNQMVDWNKSSINKQFFIDKFLKLSHHTDWCVKTFQTSDTILGCVSQRRFSLNKHKDANFFIWLDTDIVFDERGLAYLENGINTIESNDIKKYIITPEVVKYWDTTWDCVVNENYLDKELDYCKVCNPFTESGVKGDVSVETVSNNVYGQPEFKFGAGWLVVISKPLLDSIPLPESMGAYGPDDTFLMWGMQKLKQRGEDIYQFKLKNYVVCENFYYRNQSEYDLLIKRINRKDEFLQIAHNAFKSELDKL